MKAKMRECRWEGCRLDKKINPQSFELWLENENKEAFPVFISIDEKILKKWLKDNCHFDGEVYQLKEKEFPLANAPHNENGYVVRFESEIEGFVRARHMVNGKMPELEEDDLTEEEMQMGGM